MAERGGTVFEAFDPELGGRPALTIVRAPSAEGGEGRKRALERARKLLGLDHPHLVPVLEVGLEGDDLYLVSPLIEGASLAERISRGPIGAAEAGSYFEQIASGLEFAHTRGVYHGSLQPRHIFLDQSGNALVGNFGLALVKEGWTVNALVQTGDELHRAPEQAAGEEGNALSDQYAFGGLLFRMLTGYSTLSSGMPVGDLILRMNERTARLPNQPDPLPVGVAAVILKATSQNPRDRYSSIHEMVQAYQRASLLVLRSPAKSGFEPQTLKIEPEPLHESAEPGPGLTFRKRWMRLSMIAVLMLAALVGFALISASNNPKENPSGGQAAVDALEAIQGTAQAATIEALWTRIAAVEEATATPDATDLLPGDATTAMPETPWPGSPTAAITSTNPETQIPAQPWTPTQGGGGVTQPPAATATNTPPPPTNPPGATGTTPPLPTQTPQPPTSTLPPPTMTALPPTNTPILSLPTLPLPTLPLPTLPLTTLPLPALP
ncbi:MAG TPA: serine/threonine-protein kinase [Anaerolineales bacterium]|nr:serine/threonine-protein kinase [Anaerolineales bacterium]